MNGAPLATHLISQARAGSVDALDRLLERYRDYLLLVANREFHSAVRPKVGASDVVQESLIEAVGVFGQFRGDSEPELRAWLRRILINNLRDTNRRFQECEARQVGREQAIVPHDTESRVATVLPDAAPTPSAAVRQTEDAQTLQAALATLPADYARVIVLRDLEQRSFVEIGEAMNRSADAVRKMWGRAIDALSEALHGSQSA